MKKTLPVILVLAISLLCMSCPNPLSLQVPGSKLPPGTVQISFQSAQPRTVVANWATTITNYAVTLKSNNGYADMSTTVAAGSSATFSNVNAGSWYVVVNALNGAAIVGSGSGANQILVSGGSLTWNIPFTMNQGSTGGYSFTFSFPSSIGIDYVEGQLFKAGTAVGGVQVPALSGAAGKLYGTIAQNPIASGSYRLTLTFKRGGVGGTVAGVYSEAVNVWDNAISDQWLDPTGTLQTTRNFAATDFNSNDSSLSNLTDSLGALNPAFASGTLNYTLSTVASITLTPTQSIPGQYIQYSIDGGTTWAALASGSSTPGIGPGITIKIRVMANDRISFTTYSVAIISSTKDITKFGFTSPAFDAYWGSISGTNISVTVPAGVAVTSLVATFVTNGLSVAISGVPQVSGTTANNFSSSVVYTVTASDSTTKNYTVTVSVAPNYRFSVLENNGLLWSSTDSGFTWNSSGSTQPWGQLSGSKDGTILFASAGAYNTTSNIYKSSDSGATWSVLAGAGTKAFNGIAASDTGSIVGVVPYDGTSTFYYSIDSGTTWATTPLPDIWWGGGACSSDGKKWVLCNGGASSSNVSIFTGTFDGTSVWSWTRTVKGYTNEGNIYPNGWSLSKDGIKIFLTFANGNTYLSPDFGATWPSIPHPGSAVTASAMSGDGNVLVIVSDKNVYTSTNNGTTWTPAYIPGIPATDTPLTPSVSFNGSRMAFVSNGNVYVSIDSGATFAKCTVAGVGGRNWNNIFIQQQ